MAVVRTSTAGDELLTLIAARAAGDGYFDALLPGLRFVRCTQCLDFSKVHQPGPSLTVVAQGEKCVRFGTHELTYDRDHYCLITGETVFTGRVICAGRGEPYLAVSIDIPPDLVAKTLLALGEGAAAAPRETVPAFVERLDRGVADAVVRLVRAGDDPLERQVLAPLILEELVFRLLRSGGAALLRAVVGRGHDAQSIQTAMRYIRAHAARPLTVEAVARQVAMSPSHFAHRFRELARVSPMRYLKQVRLEQARTLLITDGLRIGEAATRVGYESASHFARDFKRSFGATPAAYLRRFRGE
jgi:AraC-like DNA-binding protein